jgi:hypothetical protein
MALQLRVHLKFNEHRRKGEMSHLADIIAAQEDVPHVSVMMQRPSRAMRSSLKAAYAQ